MHECSWCCDSKSMSAFVLRPSSFLSCTNELSCRTQRRPATGCGSPRRALAGCGWSRKRQDPCADPSHRASDRCPRSGSSSGSGGHLHQQGGTGDEGAVGAVAGSAAGSEPVRSAMEHAAAGGAASAALAYLPGGHQGALDRHLSRALRADASLRHRQVQGQ